MVALLIVHASNFLQLQFIYPVFKLHNTSANQTKPNSSLIFLSHFIQPLIKIDESVLFSENILFLEPSLGTRLHLKRFWITVHTKVGLILVSIKILSPCRGMTAIQSVLINTRWMPRQQLPSTYSLTNTLSTKLYTRF